MMEKRNFVTSTRTPAAGAADIDEVLAAGGEAFGLRTDRPAGELEKKASAEDEKSDRIDNAAGAV